MAHFMIQFDRHTSTSSEDSSVNEPVFTTPTPGFLPRTPPDEYTGGIYVQATPHASSRRFVELAPGDLFIHSFDLQPRGLLKRLGGSPESVLRSPKPWKYHCDRPFRP